MAKAKIEKLSFSKFFPQTTSYVSVTGHATSPEDFSVNVKIGDGDEAVSLFTTDWYKDDGLATLKAIQEGVQKAIEFHQKALKMPKVEVPEHWSIWDESPVGNGVKEAKQKAAAKKRAVKK
jgi:hypothetical protein